MQKQIQNQSRLGVEILQGCNLAKLTEEQILELKQSLWNHGVVVVRQQHLTALQLKEFTKRVFGELIIGSSYDIVDPYISLDLQTSYVSLLGNPKGETEPIEQFAWVWHQDKDSLPRIEQVDMNALYVVMLYGVEVPPEGLDGRPHATDFIDLVEAYEKLDFQQQKLLEQISMYHKAPVFSKEAIDIPKKVHPIVSTHKITGQKGLYLGSYSAIPVGMENEPEKAKQFVNDLFETVLTRTPIYSHFWQKGDILFWDNSQVMHRGIPYDAAKYRRVALRIGVVNL